MPGTISVRPVHACDLSELARLEEATWQRRGIPSLSRTDLERWYNDRSPFFLVAEREGAVCGYYYGRLIRFDVLNPKDVASFFEPTQNGWEWDRHPHVPTANSAYGINVVSVVPGAGEALNEAVRSVLATRCIRYFIGISRLSMFDRYWQKVGRSVTSMPAEADIALWYAHECAHLLGMPIWSQCPLRPKLELPRLHRPDPVLGFHVRGSTFGLLGISPGYMPDKASRDFGAIILSEFPHRP